MAPLLAECHLSWGQLCLARGEHADGQKHLERATTLFTMAVSTQPADKKP